MQIDWSSTASPYTIEGTDMITLLLLGGNTRVDIYAYAHCHANGQGQSFAQLDLHVNNAIKTDTDRDFSNAHPVVQYEAIVHNGDQLDIWIRSYNENASEVAEPTMRGTQKHGLIVTLTKI